MGEPGTQRRPADSDFSPDVTPFLYAGVGYMDQAAIDWVDTAVKKNANTTAKGNKAVLKAG